MHDSGHGRKVCSELSLLSRVEMIVSEEVLWDARALAVWNARRHCWHHRDVVRVRPVNGGYHPYRE